MELEALQSYREQFEACGASLVALCPQRQEFNEAVARESGLDFPVCQDRDNKLASAFGLTLATPPEVIKAESYLGLDLPVHNGTENWDLPIPSRYVLNRAGHVLYASLHVDHRERRDPLECLEFLREYDRRKD